jgi:acylphosphatase
MNKNSVIRLKGNFRNSGFGFSCLKQATNLDIKGEFSYLNEQEVEIHLLGSNESMGLFFHWCLQLDCIIDGKHIIEESLQKHYSEFKITNQLL